MRTRMNYAFCSLTTYSIVCKPIDSLHHWVRQKNNDYQMLRHEKSLQLSQS